MLKAETSQLRSVQRQNTPSVLLYTGSALENLAVISELILRESYDEGP